MAPWESAGSLHTALLSSAGRVVAIGASFHGQCDIPELENDEAYYVQVSAGYLYTVMLRNDNVPVICPNPDGDHEEVSRLIKDHLDIVGPRGFVGVSAGAWHVVFLRSDGQAVAYGEDQNGECVIPALLDGAIYTQVSAGRCHTVLLRSDGNAVACGINSHSQCVIPSPGPTMVYTQVSAGGLHTLLLRSDGEALSVGNQRGVPDLPAGVVFTQVSAGGDHSVFLRSDGVAVASGSNTCGQCDIPEPEEGLTYVAVSAGGQHTILLRSDGVVVTAGADGYNQKAVPKHQEEPYAERLGAANIVQLSVERDLEGETLASCATLAGVTLKSWQLTPSDLERYVVGRVAEVLKMPHIRVVLRTPQGGPISEPVEEALPFEELLRRAAANPAQ